VFISYLNVGTLNLVQRLYYVSGLMQAEPATALSLIKVGALQNATAAEPGVLQTYLAVVKWKSPTPGP
jgi:hypothetical protein